MIHCYQLACDTDCFSIPSHEFQLFMDLAVENQWTPAGTDPEPERSAYAEPWNREYLQLEGEVINAEDARGFAAGLERALQKHATGIEDVSSGVFQRATGFLAFLRRGAFQVF